MPLFMCRNTSRSVNQTRNGVRQGPKAGAGERRRTTSNSHRNRSHLFIQITPSPLSVLPFAAARERLAEFLDVVQQASGDCRCLTMAEPSLTAASFSAL